MIETTPIDIRVTNSFNSDAGQGMSVLPNVVEKEERLWVFSSSVAGISTRTAATGNIEARF